MDGSPEGLRYERGAIVAGARNAGHQASLPLRGRPIARLDGVDRALDADRRRIVTHGNHDSVADHDGGAAIAPAATKQRQALTGADVFGAPAIDDEESVRRADELT